MHSDEASVKDQKRKGHTTVSVEYSSTVLSLTLPRDMRISGLSKWLKRSPWWRHQMKTYSALLALCAGNSLVTSEFPPQRPVMRSFDVSFDLRLNKWLSKQSWGWWFEKPSCSLWRCRNVSQGHSSPHMISLQNTHTRHREDCLEVWYMYRAQLIPLNALTYWYDLHWDTQNFVGQAKKNIWIHQTKDMGCIF